MIILGIDPGYGITGYGLIEVRREDPRAPSLVEAGVLSSSKKKPLSERLHEIHKSLISILDEFSPQALAIEDTYSIPAFPKSAILIGHVQGVIYLAAAQKKIPVFSYYPLQVKKAVLGNGRGAKWQTQRMVQTVFQLKTPPRPDDVSDAIAVALCHAHRMNGG